MNSFNNGRIKKSIQKSDNYNINFGSRPKNRNILNESINRKNEPENYKNIIKKNIDVSLTQQIREHLSSQQQNQPNGLKNYKRAPHHFRKLTGLHRYEEQQRQKQVTRISSKSPYLRGSYQKPERQSLNRSSLNKSTQKIKSGQLLKQNSPRIFYRQPKSSLSQHNDPTAQTSLHKRRTSLAGEQKVGLLEQAKQLYKNGNFSKSVQILKKYVKINKGSVQGHYFLGMSLINNSDLNQGVDELLQVLNNQPSYKRSLYLVIALAYKRLTKYDQAINILTKGLILNPDYYDCLVYRGKLYLKQQNYNDALLDFTAALELNSSKGFAYLGKGTCQKQLGKISQAIQTFTQGLNTDMSNMCRQKRGILYYEQKRYQQAFVDLQSCSNFGSSIAHYYRGMLNYNKNNMIEALLCFQQSLKCDNSRQFVTSSVEMMMRIKIEQKDFYEAYHILTRADNVQIQKQILNEWRLFIQGCLFLMKKKYKQGIATLESLLSLPNLSINFKNIKNKQVKQRYKFIKPLLHLYKAFGQLSENRPQKAEKQYILYQQLCEQFKISKFNLSKDYNKLIINCYKTFPKQSRKLIQQAIKLIPSKPEPYLYLAFDIVNNQFQAQSDPILKNQFITQAIENLTIGIDYLPQLSNNHISTFYYFRSILYLYKSDFNKCVADVDKAIQKSQDNIPKYFYLRGLIFAIFGNFSQAVQDLTVSINLDQKYAKPYLERAKCLQIQGNSNQAFLDLQRYITLAPQDQQIHKYAGFLLFQNCAYQDCLSAFSHGTQNQGDYELVLTKAKCHFLLGDDEIAIKLFKNYCQNTYHIDYQSDITMMQICGKIRQFTKINTYQQQIVILNNLIQNKNEQNCKIFKIRDMHQLKGSIYLLLGKYNEAIAAFQNTLKLFNSQKSKQMEKHFIQDSQQFQDQWSQVQIKFNLSIAYLSLEKYQEAKNMLLQFQKSSQKGRNWKTYMNLIEDLIAHKNIETLKLDTFQQNHRISKLWPKVKLPKQQIYLSMAFSYPFVQPPQLLPQFDQQFFEQFSVKKSQQKPEAPWINRGQAGLVFTPNIQVYQNLQLSMTTTKQNESDQNKPISEMNKSGDLSHSDFQLQTQQLKKKFKLDSLVQMKLKKLMQKNG